MTPALHTGSTRCELPDAHAAIAPVDVLLGVRRTLYQVAVELLDPAVTDPLPHDLIDSPSVRGRIALALATGDATACVERVPITEVVSQAGWLPAGPNTVPMASRRDANRLLSDVLAAVDVQLGAKGRAEEPLRILTESDGEPFFRALDVVRDGIALARSLSQRLVDDLLVHVSLLAVADPVGAGPLVSASARAFPGFVLLRYPSSAIEVAEGLVHEAAHQKLFDLAITGAMLSAESDRCPPFEPTWPPAGRQWQMEQCLAAAHAYSCLARFADDATDSRMLDDCGPDSLLPMARERSLILGEWLFERAGYLGADAHLLLKGLYGRSPVSRPAEQQYGDQALAEYVAVPGLTIRRCPTGDRVIVGHAAQAVELYVVNEDAAVLLETLGRSPADEEVDAFYRQLAQSRREPAGRLATVASSLAALGLVRLRAVN